MLLASTVALGKIPPEITKLVEHSATVRVGNRAYDIAKVSRDGVNVTEMAFDENAKQVDVADVRKQYLAQFTKTGKIHPTLDRLFAQQPAAAQLVMVWLQLPALPVLPRPVDDNNLEAVLKRLEAQHLQNVKAFSERKRAVITSVGLAPNEVSEDYVGTPFVIAKLTAGRVKQLAANAATQMFLHYDTKAIMDLADAMSIAGANTVVSAGTRGAGIKVAVYEDCPDDTTNLVIAGAYHTAAGLGCSANNHTRHVTGIIRNNQAVSGFAPDASIYSADRSDNASLNWAIDTQKVQAINQSFHRGAEIGDGMQADDLYKDYKVLHYPWPTIVQAAGNWCASGTSCYEGGSDIMAEFVNHKGFNSISIGNHDDTAANMSPSSVFRNPTSPHGDRELPELSANGTGVTTVGLTKSGTSMASPAVTGSVALLQSARTVLKIWPEGIRALLFAGANRNVVTHPATLSGGGAAASAPNFWWADVSADRDAFDGAGALNVNRSFEIARNRYAGSSLERGWDIGTYREASFESGYATKTYQVRIPSSGPRHLRVALAWNSTATVTGTAPAAVYASQLDIDLDVRVFNSSGAVVARSASYDNSYEVVDFDATHGQTYTVKVRRFAFKPGAWTWFGVAWDVQ